MLIRHTVSYNIIMPLPFAEEAFEYYMFVTILTLIRPQKRKQANKNLKVTIESKSKAKRT